jgi:hypothetical protein
MVRVPAALYKLEPVKSGSNGKQAWAALLPIMSARGSSSYEKVVGYFDSYIVHDSPLPRDFDGKLHLIILF